MAAGALSEAKLAWPRDPQDLATFYLFGLIFVSTASASSASSSLHRLLTQRLQLSVVSDRWVFVTFGLGPNPSLCPKHSYLPTFSCSVPQDPAQSRFPGAGFGLRLVSAFILWSSFLLDG